MTDKDLILKNLASLADAITTLFGKNCEVCVHDLSSLQNSLIHIKGDVTHRQPGAPATDLLIKMLQKSSEDLEDVHNYKTTTSDGRYLKSTTTFIRDKSGKPIAAFCINFDTTDFYNASQALTPFFTIQEQENHPGETFANSIADTVEALFSQAMAGVGKHPASMNLDEKTILVENLENNGTFQLKGAVEQVAAKMGVTKYTVYNYLKKIRHSNPTQQKEV